MERTKNLPAAVPAASEESWRLRAQVWRSPTGQPAWARPALLVIAALAALSYSWHTGSTIEVYYAAAVRSNSVYQQVFDYNGVSRFGQLPPDQVLGQTLGTPLFTQAEPAPTWHRLFAGSYGLDTGWRHGTPTGRRSGTTTLPGAAPAAGPWHRR